MTLVISTKNNRLTHSEGVDHSFIIFKTFPLETVALDLANARSILGKGMHRIVPHSLFLIFILVARVTSSAQSDYKVVAITDAGTISGTVKWSGPVPRPLTFPITKDTPICDPDSNKMVDLDRLIIGPQGGVANTIVYLRNITSGKALELPEPRRHLDQKRCRYIPHILLVPQNATLTMMSSDATLHTIHMDGAATFNLPFPFTNRPTTRAMSNPGLVHLRCNGGHVWMNAEIMVVSHPYYAVTDETGHFEFADVPPGTYQIVAWHEGWNLLGKEHSYDVLTERSVERPLFSEPRTWEKSITVTGKQESTVDFALSK
jgi:hypothetical protein